ISDEMPGPWRQYSACCATHRLTHFNLRRDARPLATLASPHRHSIRGLFQSQTRCQAPGDAADHSPSGWLDCYFNLRRDARPLATKGFRYHRGPGLPISISDEMPGPWRLPGKEENNEKGFYFN